MKQINHYNSTKLTGRDAGFYGRDVDQADRQPLDHMPVIAALTVIAL